MRVTKHYSLVVSDKVLTLVRVIAKSYPGSGIDVTCYANCREQGYHLVHPGSLSELNRAVTFAQHRNSDDIRIWCGSTRDFGVNGIPSDALYPNDHLFPWNQKRQAAIFIVDYLIGKR
jgi:hypothetical protein